MLKKKREKVKVGNRLTLFVSFVSFLSALVFHVVAEISAFGGDKFCSREKNKKQSRVKNSCKKNLS
jgi:hypothetical protein